MQKKISLYTGPGTWVHPFNLSAYDLLGPDTLIHGDWDQKSTHLIMPGGRDRPYMDALKKKGNEKILNFVKNGGTYIGICAGAYYGADRIEFDKGTHQEIIEERELKFFKGVAIGPVFQFGSYEYVGTKSSLAVKLLLKKKSLFSYFNGGCTFSGDLSRVKVLARYEELPGKPPAIIVCPHGKGKAILSGAHIEAPYHTLLGVNFPELEASEPHRRELWNDLLSK